MSKDINSICTTVEFLRYVVAEGEFYETEDVSTSEGVMALKLVRHLLSRQEKIETATEKLVEACEFVCSTTEPCEAMAAEMQRIAKLNNLRRALAELKEASK